MKWLRGKRVRIVGTGTNWDERRLEEQTIGGDRRNDRRYDICLEVQWKLMHRRRVVDRGSGVTRDLSSHGILFEASRRLPTGHVLELSIAWPALLHGTTPMKLVALGRIVRSDGYLVAIRMTQHEFYTTGGAAERRNLETGAAAVPQEGWDFDLSAGLHKN
jgi:hypothetical protein